MRFQRQLVNFLLFQSSWFGTILLAKSNIAFLPAFALAAIHMLFVSKNKKLELRLILRVAALGIILDQTMSFAHIYRFNADIPLHWPPLIPVWLASMWFAFATTLLHSLAWASKPNIPTPILFAFAGPATYMVGSAFGILHFRDPQWLTWAVHAVAWGFVGYKTKAWVNHPYGRRSDLHQA